MSKTTLRVAVLGALLGLAASPQAQGSRNVDLLANVFMDARGSDVWGHVDPITGKEYAIVGNFAGTVIFDCSDPTSPIQRGFIPSDNPPSSQNRWRDMKTYGTHLYVVSEAHPGVQIIDLTNPDQPVKVTTWGTGIWFSTHNIAMDVETGIAYACGTNSGMHMFDVRSNPTNPTYIGQYNTTSVHDAMIQDGRAFLCDTGANRLTTLDVRSLPGLPMLSSIQSAGRGSCHSVWATRDNELVAVCHETSGGEVVMYDVTSPDQPVFKSIFQTGGSSAIVHNPMIVDRVCHVAWNTEGYQALDLSDPANPVRVGWYDTWSGFSAGSNGLWGIYAQQPSGVIYGTDRTAGFFVWKPKSTAMRYGGATSGNTTPELHTFGAAWTGNANFRFEVAGAAPAQAGVLVISQGRAGLNLQGLEILVDFTLPHLALPIAAGVDGEAVVAMPLAANLPVGVKVYAQAFMVDAGGPLGLSASHGREVEFFAL